MKLLSNRCRRSNAERRQGPRRFRTISAKRVNKTSEERWTRFRTENGTQESQTPLPGKIPRGKIKNPVTWYPQREVPMVAIPPAPEALFLQKELVQETGHEEAAPQEEAGVEAGGEGEAGMGGVVIIHILAKYPLSRRANL